MLTLSLSHSIFLTLGQRYDLIDSRPIELIGSNVPVWFFHGSTSEPGTEVFCKYLLRNEKEKDFYINFDGKEFEINVPNIPKDFKMAKRISDEEWRKLSRKQLDELYSLTRTPASVLDLQSESVGGSGYLYFKYFDKMKLNGRFTSIVHHVEINTMQNLLNSLEF